MRGTLEETGGDPVKYKDYYEVLGIDKNADDKAIRRAYRKLAKAYHPDHNIGDMKAEDKFKEISEAYEVLGDKEKRAKYDQFGHNYNGQGGSDFDPRTYGFGDASYHSTSGDYSDFFNMFFGDDLFGSMNRSASFGRTRSNKGNDIEAVLEVDVEEAYYGLKKSFTLQGPMAQGQQQQRSTITVTIPKGIITDEKIRLKGKGELSMFGGEPGDLILKIKVASTSEMVLEGLNTTSDLRLMPWEALFGCEKKVETLSGTMNVKIPKNMSSGKKIRLKGKGYKDRKGNVGNHYLRLMIDNPKHMTPEMEKHYRALERSV